MFRLTIRQLAVFLLCISALSVLAQNANPSNASPRAVTPIQAYTVEFKMVNVQTLANGTTITRETKELRARDSQSRTLNITTQPQFTNGRIMNPVDNIEIVWNSAMKKKADVIRLPPQDQRQGCWATDSHRASIGYALAPGAPVRGGAAATTVIDRESVSPKNQVTREDLGTMMIEGLEAKGERVTTVIPAGRVGNDSPITTIHEWWRAADLPFSLRDVYDDPRNGRRITEVVSLTLGEPDPSLFQAPEGYEIENEEMHTVPCQQ